MNEVDIEIDKKDVTIQTIPRVSLIIPSLNPDEKLVRTVRGCIEAGFDDIIVVNDGSRPDTLKYFPKKSEFPQVTLLTHEKNLGKGAA
ncbi:MAG TPA: glycosyltransferase, partial [Bacillota bacterium]|nr:glycosyltransferase [Bacillota bacterium]